MRDPWPADEPRFASLARDMVTTGEWLFPRVGGDLYQDKPPVFFWLLAASYALIGSLRWSFLLPSLLAAAGTLLLIYDIGRMLIDRRAGLIAALGVASTLQFVLVMRGAQIDGVLCFLTTLSLYALLRHLLLGPAWGWYFIGGLAAGVGVATKGVGFLPLLVLLPFVLLRRWEWRGLASLGAGGPRWLLAPAGFVLGVGVWLVPMLVAVAVSESPDYAAYRDEILFKQTVTRYSASWHHVKPWNYFIVEVIPLLWLPWSVALFWLVPRFAAAWRARDARVWLPLAWVLLVLVFFSMSPGKRGVYLLPALPGLAIASLPSVATVVERRGFQRAMLALGAVLLLAGAVILIGHWAGHAQVAALLTDARLDGIGPVATFVGLAALGIALAAWRAPAAAWCASLAALALVWGYGVAPKLNPERTASEFIHGVLDRVPSDHTLALHGYKEQFLLHTDRPTVNFGHRRWLEGEQESYDAAAWLNAGANRLVLMTAKAQAPCFVAAAQTSQVGKSSDDQWILVSGPASADCASKGDARRAILYAHPTDPR
jgi:4-amino-4-deoxy-L-arabinose transferase-like glycosyltransferase